MSVSSIRLSLWLGAVIPERAPGDVMRALRAVEVTQSDAAPWGFQLTFQAEVTGEFLGSYRIVEHPLLQPFSRVAIQVSVDGDASTLVNGVITHHQFVPGVDGQMGSFIVTGEDLSVAMDIETIPLEYPLLPDAAIVEAVLAKWLVLGIVPAVIPPLAVMVPLDNVPQQLATDRAILRSLAQRNGHVFYLSPIDVPGVSVPLGTTAYWGPPPRLDLPTAVLDVGGGVPGTVTSFQAAFDAQAPSLIAGVSMELEEPPPLPLPILTFTSTREPPLASKPAIDTWPEFTRREWLTERARNGRYDPGPAQYHAQVHTDVSTDNVVTVQSEITPARLGSVVTAPGVIGVRGAGVSYDGLYYLKAATHRINLATGEQWSYTESLTLTREGVGTTTPILEAL